MTRQALVHDSHNDRHHDRHNDSHHDSHHDSHLTEKPDWWELQPRRPHTHRQPPTSSPQQVAQLLSPTTGANPVRTPKFSLCKSFLSGKVFSDLQCSSFWKFTVRGEAWRPKLEFLSRLGWNWKDWAARTQVCSRYGRRSTVVSCFLKVRTFGSHLPPLACLQFAVWNFA